VRRILRYLLQKNRTELSALDGLWIVSPAWLPLQFSKKTEWEKTLFSNQVSSTTPRRLSWIHSQILGLRMRNVKWNRFPNNLRMNSTQSHWWRLVTWMHDTCKFESSQSEESRAQLVDSSKTYSKPLELSNGISNPYLIIFQILYVGEAPHVEYEYWRPKHNGSFELGELRIQEFHTPDDGTLQLHLLHVWDGAISNTPTKSLTLFCLHVLRSIPKHDFSSVTLLYDRGGQTTARGPHPARRTV